MKESKKLTQDVVELKLAQELSGWEYCEKHNAIEKDFLRKNFLDCVSFIQHIAKAAEAADHHPDLLLHDYKKVRVMLSTHDAGGITQNDFDLAATIEKL